MASRCHLFWTLFFLVILEGLFIGTITNWPSLFEAPNSRIKEALYVNSPEASAAYIFQRRRPKNILLFVAILTHASRKARRDAIRDTWFTECKLRTDEVYCAFFTDQAGLENETKNAILQEHEENNDLIFLQVEDNLAFTERLLQTMEWASERHKFDYFLRIDDDHFLCLDRLLYELNFRPKEALYWGFVHCKPKIVRVDEAWLLLTHDLIEEILEKRNSSLLCSPYGDQAAALWMMESKKNVTYFMDNQRIVHKSAGKDQRFLLDKDICQKYLSLHGSYPRSMRQLWLSSYVLRKETSLSGSYNITEIEPFAKLCRHSPVFDYMGFFPEFRFEPKPCSGNPKWPISKKPHVGREEAGERYSKYK